MRAQLPNASIMRKLLLGAIALGLGGVLVACVSPLRDRHGERVYTQVALWVDREVHVATNYGRGWFVPINTRVTILGSSGESIDVEILANGREFTLVNNESYTRVGIEKIYERYFGPSPVDLSGFDPETQRAIRNGKVAKGMSKEAVLLARGFPPAHRTNAPFANTWYYWDSRHDKRLILFVGGEVSHIQD